jgi:hypothetical protein
MEEIQMEKKMMTEDFNSQAAQEARKEKERETLALEENQRELERMAEKRLITVFVESNYSTALTPLMYINVPYPLAWNFFCSAVIRTNTGIRLQSMYSRLGDLGWPLSGGWPLFGGSTMGGSTVFAVHQIQYIGGSCHYVMSPALGTQPLIFILKRTWREKQRLPSQNLCSTRYGSLA